MERNYNVESQKRKGLEPSEISLIVINIIVWTIAIVRMVTSV